jgi:hypothetical protein
MLTGPINFPPPPPKGLRPLKLTIKLDAQDVKQAIATYVHHMTGLPVHAENVKSGSYSWETPSVEYDTDAEQALTSLEAEQELERVTAIQEAA